MVVRLLTHLNYPVLCVDMSTQQYRVRSGEDLGRVLRDARAVHGLTQQQLVTQLQLGIDRTRLARIEAGEGFQSLDRALSVLRRLGIEVFASVPTPPPSSNHERTHPHHHADAQDGEREKPDELRDEPRDEGGGFP